MRPCIGVFCPIKIKKNRMSYCHRRAVPCALFILNSLTLQFEYARSHFDLHATSQHKKKKNYYIKLCVAQLIHIYSTQNSTKRNPNKYAANRSKAFQCSGNRSTINFNSSSNRNKRFWLPTILNFIGFTNTHTLPI